MPMPITHTTSALRKLTTYSFRVAAYAKAANLKCQLVYDAMGSNSKSEVGYCLLFNLIKYLWNGAANAVAQDEAHRFYEAMGYILKYKVESWGDALTWSPEVRWSPALYEVGSAWSVWAKANCAMYTNHIPRCALYKTVLCTLTTYHAVLFTNLCYVH
jgi:hypothetical protein